jgi:hypothetical protein
VKSRYLPSEGALPLREIEAVDGSIFLERAVQVDPPRSYAYRLLGGLRPPISWLVDEGAGRIELEPAGHDGTQISWVFAWRLRSVVAWPILALLAIPFRRAMERCLWKTRVRLERQALLAP